jgi:hypothetical protein
MPAMNPNPYPKGRWTFSTSNQETIANTHAMKGDRHAEIGTVMGKALEGFDGQQASSRCW